MDSTMVYVNGTFFFIFLDAKESPDGNATVPLLIVIGLKIS